METFTKREREILDVFGIDEQQAEEDLAAAEEKEQRKADSLADMEY